MKISHFPKWCNSVYNAITIDEVMIIAIAIIGLVYAVVIPNVARAKKQAEQKQVNEQYPFNVGDTVMVQGIDQKGTVNYLPESGYADILVIGKNGEPTILKGINVKLLKRQ